MKNRKVFMITYEEMKKENKRKETNEIFQKNRRRKLFN